MGTETHHGNITVAVKTNTKNIIRHKGVFIKGIVSHKKEYGFKYFFQQKHG